MIVGISGYGGAGKDTAADVLVAEAGFVKMSFADPMRAMAAAMNPIVGIRRDEFEQAVPVRYVEAVGRIGYREAKDTYPEIRTFLQRLGTDAGREVLGRDVWVNAQMDRIRDGIDVVLADMRFKNEAAAVESRGGLTVRIERPDCGPVNPHISEVDLDDWPFMARISNDSTVEALASAIMEVTANER